MTRTKASKLCRCWKSGCHALLRGWRLVVECQSCTCTRYTPRSALLLFFGRRLSPRSSSKHGRSLFPVASQSMDFVTVCLALPLQGKVRSWREASTASPEWVSRVADMYVLEGFWSMTSEVHCPLFPAIMKVDVWSRLEAVKHIARQLARRGSGQVTLCIHPVRLRHCY